MVFNNGESQLLISFSSLCIIAVNDMATHWEKQSHCNRLREVGVAKIQMELFVGNYLRHSVKTRIMLEMAVMCAALFPSYLASLFPGMKWSKLIGASQVYSECDNTFH